MSREVSDKDDYYERKSLHNSGVSGSSIGEYMNPGRLATQLVIRNEKVLRYEVVSFSLELYVVYYSFTLYV